MARKINDLQKNQQKADEKARRTRTVRVVLKKIKPYSALIALSLILAVITSVSALYIPISVGRAIDNIVAKGAVNLDALKECLALIVALAAVSAASGFLMNLLNNRVTFRVVKDLRDEAFSKIHRLPISYLDSHPSGETVSRIISDADQFADGLLMGFTQFFTGAITIIGTLVFMFVLSPLIALVVVALTPISLFVASFIAKKTYSMFGEMSKARGEETAIINEVVTNEKLVRAFGREGAELERFDKANECLREKSLKTVFFSSLTNPSTRVVNSIVYAAVGFVGALLVITDPLSFTVGALSSFLGYASSYTKPFNEISGVITELQGAIACASRLVDFIALEEEKDSFTEKSPLTEGKIEGEVVFSDVSFSYTSDRELLKNISFSVKRGEKVAIVGATGCGKTTLINLIMRFYDPQKGAILIDGVDIKDFDRAYLRSQIGMVLQDTWLKSGTVRENIKLGRKSASDEEMIAAAKASHAHSFIKRLPNGYDTVIVEGDTSLSKGERQLLSITRLMLALPPMLILDEATSSIDTRTEQRIQRAFGKMMKGRTTFIVAHRLSTVTSADLILVLKDGNIVEKGTHRELLSRGGEYSALYKKGFAHGREG